MINIRVDIEKYRQAAHLLEVQEQHKAKGNLFAQLLTERGALNETHFSAPQANGSRLVLPTLAAIIGETGDIRPCEILDTKLETYATMSMTS